MITYKIKFQIVLFNCNIIKLKLLDNMINTGISFIFELFEKRQHSQLWWKSHCIFNDCLTI